MRLPRQKKQAGGDKTKGGSRNNSSFHQCSTDLLVGKPEKSKQTCVCNVGQVVVPGASRKLLQFSVRQVKSPTRRSLLERLLHAPARRYCGRQLGSIPSSHQTLRSTSSVTLFETSAPLSCPADPQKLTVACCVLQLLSNIFNSKPKQTRCDCSSRTTRYIGSTNKRQR